MLNPVEQVQREVSLWDGISVSPHRFGGVEFNFGKAEVGHIHRNGLLDIPFPMRVRDELLLEGLVSKHHVLPNSGWVSFEVRSEADVDRAIWLLRLSYLRYLLRPKKRLLNQSDPSVKATLEELRTLNLSPGLNLAFEQTTRFS